MESGDVLAVSARVSTSNDAKCPVVASAERCWLAQFQGLAATWTTKSTREATNTDQPGRSGVVERSTSTPQADAAAPGTQVTDASVPATKMQSGGFGMG